MSRETKTTAKSKIGIPFHSKAHLAGRLKRESREIENEMRRGILEITASSLEKRE